MKQRQCVYDAVSKVIDFEDGTSIDPTDSQRKEIHAMVFDCFKAETVDFSDTAKAKYTEDKKLNSYVSGLISNWLRKDKRMNGNTKYVPTNPGSRTGQGDPQIKELRKLLSLHKGTDNEARIQSAIDKRITEKKAEKQEDIDVDNLPDELKDLVG